MFRLFLVPLTIAIFVGPYVEIHAEDITVSAMRNTIGKQCPANPSRVNQIDGNERCDPHGRNIRACNQKYDPNVAMKAWQACYETVSQCREEVVEQNRIISEYNNWIEQCISADKKRANTAVVPRSPAIQNDSDDLAKRLEKRKQLNSQLEQTHGKEQRNLEETMKNERATNRAAFIERHKNISPAEEAASYERERQNLIAKDQAAHPERNSQRELENRKCVEKNSNCLGRCGAKSSIIENSRAYRTGYISPSLMSGLAENCVAYCSSEGQYCRAMVLRNVDDIVDASYSPSIAKMNSAASKFNALARAFNAGIDAYNAEVRRRRIEQHNAAVEAENDEADAEALAAIGAIMNGFAQGSRSYSTPPSAAPTSPPVARPPSGGGNTLCKDGLVGCASR
jgi:hypothetical protein